MKDHRIISRGPQRAAVMRIVALLLIALLAAPELLLAAFQPQLPDPGDTGVSKQQQEQIGQKAVAEVYKQMPVLPDSSPVTRYVQQLGSRLASAIPSQYSWPYQFHVIPEKDINAFALPGGPIFVNIGTINAATNEAELAGVIAHEMSHVYMQHSIKQAKKEQGTSVLVGLLGGLLGAYGGTAGQLASLGMRIGAGAVFMKYSRADEAQADAVGAIIMYKAGYNPQAMADFFKKLEQQGGSGPQFLSDHPNPGNREASIQKEIQNWPPIQTRVTSAQFQQAKADASKVKTYTAQEIQQRAKSGGGWNNQPPQGTPVSQSGSTNEGANPAAPVNVSVSTNWKPLDHQGFTIEYPDNWQAYGDAQSAVTIAPPGGVSQNAVAYGVMIDSFQPQNANSLDQATQELISTIQKQNPGLQPIGSAQNITVNGIHGRSIDLRGTSPIEDNGRPAAERDWLVTLPQQNGSLLYMVFISPETDFNHLRPSYEKMLRTLKVQ